MNYWNSCQRKFCLLVGDLVGKGGYCQSSRVGGITKSQSHVAGLKRYIAVEVVKEQSRKEEGGHGVR